MRSYLLTGNTRGGAQAKLTHYGLWSFFPDGAFAEDAQRAGDDRPARACSWPGSAGPVTEADAFVIGDTPHDIDCANAIGVRTIAVATGGYTRRRAARRTRPWRLFDELPPPDDFVRADRDRAAQSRSSPPRYEARHPPRARAVAGNPAGPTVVSRPAQTPIPTGAPLLAAEPATWESARERGRRAARVC